MKKALFCFLLIIVIFMLSIIGAFAEGTNGVQNLKEKYRDIYAMDNECKPLVTPNGIAVDSEENIYIVNTLFSKVQVYKNNQYLYSYTIYTDGSMKIKIDQNDNIYLSLARSYIGLKFFNKQLIEAVDDYRNYSDYVNQEIKLNYCKDVYGNTYQLHSIFGYDYITKKNINGEISTVYSIPISHYLLKLFLGILFILFFLGVVLLVNKIKKECHN